MAVLAKEKRNLSIATHESTMVDDSSTIADSCFLQLLRNGSCRANHLQVHWWQGAPKTAGYQGRSKECPASGGVKKPHRSRPGTVALRDSSLPEVH